MTQEMTVLAACTNILVSCWCPKEKKKSQNLQVICTVSKWITPHPWQPSHPKKVSKLTVLSWLPQYRGKFTQQTEGTMWALGRYEKTTCILHVLRPHTAAYHTNILSDFPEWSPDGAGLSTVKRHKAALDVQQAGPNIQFVIYVSLLVWFQSSVTLPW